MKLKNNEEEPVYLKDLNPDWLKLVAEWEQKNIIRPEEKDEDKDDSA